MFFFFYFTAVLSSILMIACVNPINAVLFLIATFLSVSMIFLLLNAEFLALIFIIIYVGAIAVLFLFIVMMINIKRIEKDNTTYLTIGGIILFVFFSQFFVVFLQPCFESTYPLEHLDAYSFSNSNVLDEGLRVYTLQRFGVVLFSLRPVLLILAGMILLIAMIGSIYLTNEKRGFSMKKQFNQLSRSYSIYNVHIY